MKQLSEQKQKILKKLIDYKELSTEMVLLLASGRGKYGFQQGYDVLKELKEEKIIKKSERVSGSGNYTFTSYYIAPRAKEEMFPNDELAKRSLGTNTIESQVKKGDTALMCWLAGVVAYEKTIDGEQAFFQIENMDLGHKNINPFVEDITKFNLYAFRYMRIMYGVFIPFEDIRAKFRVTAEDKQHFNYSSTTGVLVGKKNIYMLYHANHGYLSTRAHAERMMAERVMHYLARIGITSLTGTCTRIKRGIIFVRNVKDFRRLVTNMYGFECNRFRDFDYMHIVPETNAGLELLRLINSYEDITHLVVKKIISLGKYQYNQRSYFAEYFLLTEKESGRLVYYGVDMNFNTLAHVYDECQRFKIEFCIMCFEWQEHYYRSVFGDGLDYVILQEDAIVRYLSNL